MLEAMQEAMQKQDLILEQNQTLEVILDVVSKKGIQYLNEYLFSCI